MKASAILVILLNVTLPLFAQPVNDNLQSMVEAERAFVQMAKDQNRRDAFLFYLSDDAVTSGPNGPIKGKDEIRKQAVGNEWLHWEVAYSDIASSGDFGYNTGPWAYRVNKSDEKPVAYGEFNSVWKTQADGSWKNILDIGVRHGEPAEKTAWKTTAFPLKASRAKAESASDLFSKEKEFETAYDRNASQSYQRFSSSEIRFCRSGSHPVTGIHEKFLTETAVAHSVELMDGGIASSGDLGYVYGTAEITVSEGSETKNKKAIFVRIWKKERGTEWRIVLDVLTY